MKVPGLSVAFCKRANDRVGYEYPIPLDAISGCPSVRHISIPEVGHLIGGASRPPVSDVKRTAGYEYTHLFLLYSTGTFLHTLYPKLGLYSYPYLAPAVQLCI